MVGIGGGAGLDRMLFGSQGMQVNRMLDALGLPDSMGDMIGAQMDAARGDWAGYARNMMDLTGGMTSKGLDQLFGQGLPAPHFAQRPHAMLGRGRKLWGSKFSTPFGTHEISRERLGPGGLFGKAIGRSMERAILTNPAFKARMERVLGGRIIPDGRADGKVTVERFRPHFPGIPFSNQIAANPMLSGMYNSLARMQRNLEGVMNQFVNAGQNVAGGSVGADPMGANKSGGTSGSSGTGAIKDNDMANWANQMGMSPPMSFEDILFLLMLKYAKNKEKQILDKAKELLRKSEEGGKSGGAEGGGRSGRGGGLLGGIGQIAGGVLGGMVGGPIGSAIGGKLGGAVGGALGGGGGAGGAQGGGQAGGGGYDPMDAKKSDATDQAILQKMMNDLQKVYQLLTNIMKSMHDMGMAAARNIR